MNCWVCRNPAWKKGWQGGYRDAWMRMFATFSVEKTLCSAHKVELAAYLVRSDS